MNPLISPNPAQQPAEMTRRIEALERAQRSPARSMWAAQRNWFSNVNGAARQDAGSSGPPTTDDSGGAIQVAAMVPPTGRILVHYVGAARLQITETMCSQVEVEIFAAQGADPPVSVGYGQLMLWGTPHHIGSQITVLSIAEGLTPGAVTLYARYRQFISVGDKTKSFGAVGLETLTASPL